MKRERYESSTVEVFKKRPEQYDVNSSFASCSCAAKEVDPGHPCTAIHRKGCTWLAAQPDFYANHGYPEGKP